MNFFTDTSGRSYHSRENHLCVIKGMRSGMWPVGQEETEGPAGMISLPATPTTCPAPGSCLPQLFPGPYRNLRVWIPGEWGRLSVWSLPSPSAWCLVDAQ